MLGPISLLTIKQIKQASAKPNNKDCIWNVIPHFYMKWVKCWVTHSVRPTSEMIYIALTSTFSLTRLNSKQDYYCCSYSKVNHCQFVL